MIEQKFPRKANESTIAWIKRLLKDQDYLTFQYEREIQSLHSKNIPVYQADNFGIYQLLPNGEKKYL